MEPGNQKEREREKISQPLLFGFLKSISEAQNHTRFSKPPSGPALSIFQSILVDILQILGFLRVLL